MIACIYQNILWVSVQNDIWTSFLIFSASIYVSTSRLMSCRKCCVEILCMLVVVSMFWTVYSTDFAFPMISSLSSIGGLDIKVFFQGGLKNQNDKICFYDNSQNVYVFVDFPSVLYDFHFQVLLEV